MTTADPSEIELSPDRTRGFLAEGASVIDVREGYERDAGYIEGSRHIELPALSAAAASIDPARPVVFVCRIGGRSMMAATALRAAGYEAYTMTGGMLAWVAAGLPILPDGGFVADH